jgi:hypothetical protein
VKPGSGTAKGGRKDLPILWRCSTVKPFWEAAMRRIASREKGKQGRVNVPLPSLIRRKRHSKVSTNVSLSMSKVGSMEKPRC